MEHFKNIISKYIQLSPEVFEIVSTTVSFEILSRNTLILEQGKPNKHIYLLKKGVVREFTVENNDITKNFWVEDEFFGDIMTYITGDKSGFSYEAIEDVELYKIDIHEFRLLFKSHHEVCNLGRMLAEEYIVKTQHNAVFHTNVCPITKYKIFLEQHKFLINRVKLKHIASYLQISAETLSRIRKKLYFD